MPVNNELDTICINMIHTRNRSLIRSWILLSFDPIAYVQILFGSEQFRTSCLRHFSGKAPKILSRHAVSHHGEAGKHI